MSKLHIRLQDEAVQFICNQDSTMKKLITVIGDIEVDLRSDYFASLVRSITGQQISVSAASAIYGRLVQLLNGKITAEEIMAKSEKDLRETGLTKRKVEYVKDLSEKVLKGNLDLEHIEKYDDETLMKQLTQVKGIGKWTAEMFLIFTLGRKDILAIDDVGIQRAAMWLYGVEKSERRNILIEKSPLWKPHRSVVSFYLWEAGQRGFISNFSSIDELVEKGS